MTKLKLRAAEVSDIEVIASAVQDSIFQIGQTRFDREGRSFTLRLSRYRHEAEKPQRIECGLRFDGVMAVKTQGVETSKSEAFAVVGGVIRLSVEAIDLTLADIGEARPTKRIPKHDS